MMTLTKSPLDWKDKAGQNHIPAVISTDLHGARGHYQGIHDFCILSGFRHMEACNEVGGKEEGVVPRVSLQQGKAGHLRKATP